MHDTNGPAGARTAPPIADGSAPSEPTAPTAPAPPAPATGTAGGPRPPAALRAAGAAAGGLLLFLAFPPLDLWFLAPPGIALAVLSVYGTAPRRGAWLGLVAGIAFMLPSVAWVRSLGVDVWLGLAALEAVFYAAFGAGAALAVRLPLWPLWTAGLWVASEWVRGLVPFGGFPWARAAFSQAGSPFAPYAALGGVPLVSFAVALCGGLLALLALVCAWGAGRTGGAGGAGGTGGAGGMGGAGSPGGMSGVWRAAALTLAGAVAVPALGLAVPRPGDEGRTVNVAVVQGNVPGRGMAWMGDERAVVLRNHADKTHELAAAVRAGRVAKPDIVVWPENSSDIDPYLDESARSTIDAAVKDIGVPVLVGVVASIGDTERATRSLVWDPVAGPGAYYDKQQLVPFGEYTPMQELVQSLYARARLVGRQSRPGTVDGDLRMGPVTIGAVNCYEIAFDGVVRGTVRAGGSPIVVQANNATYALTDLPVQQLAMYRLRAVEHNRAVVAAATTGVSAVVRPDGDVSWRSEELVPAVHVERVPVRTGTTLATTLGPAPEWLLVALSLGALPWALRRGPRTVGARRDH
ncbi:apolipoprotein N-acyltransferase [Sinosporangium album]|uniref:Apolipoprotein N-acyltransferase n=1 Tax=Sinosporangium album TaxID=504805 RepID=A0A1G8DNY4_9ACTN|nr:apolipoprotein N-acyltransferase [Sinosporangium album]SDH59423.1 apolipoprotein N-acyltransferase [Sinosporangium album]